MQKMVINSTEGGAKIKGCIQLSLKEVIEKYCQEPIDKSKIKPLLTCADNGDELIEKVVPLLKNDIDTLKEIITNSRKGMAVGHGMKKLLSQDQYTHLLPKKKKNFFDKLNKEAAVESQGNPLLHTTFFFQKVIAKLKKSRLKTIIIMSFKNFVFSEAAHQAAVRNPLVNVAIYGASRQIQTRGLKVDGGINNLLTNQKEAITRVERNIIILKAAFTAATGLKRSYKKTLKLLKKYNKTKDNSLLVNDTPEEINLDDAEDYFEKGNWAHPLLDAIKILKSEKEVDEDTQLKAEMVYAKALKMKKNAIKKAKESETEYHDKMNKLLKYNELLSRAKEEGGKNKDFDAALKLMKKAVKLMPDEQEARWGLATALHHAKQFKESIIEYQKLIEKFPASNLFKFEYGQVLLQDGQIQDGLKEIGKVMEATEEFDSFLTRLGEIYVESKMFKEAITAYKSYLKKFPFDYKAWIAISNCYTKLGKDQQAQVAYRKALEINPNYKN
jgi:tetratricopeptide (TPR) repeat protein